MIRMRYSSRIISILVVILFFNLGQMLNPLPTFAQAQADLYIQDTPSDSGLEPNPDSGPMYVSEDIWVLTTPDINYDPNPFY